MLEFEKSCRLCLEDDVDNCKNIFDLPNLDEDIYQCVGIKILCNDSYPIKNICFNCLNEIQQWKKFKVLCETSQATLENLYKEKNKIDASELTPPFNLNYSVLSDITSDIDTSKFDHDSVFNSSLEHSFYKSTPLPESEDQKHQLLLGVFQDSPVNDSENKIYSQITPTICYGENFQPSTSFKKLTPLQDSQNVCSSLNNVSTLQENQKQSSHLNLSYVFNLPSTSLTFHQDGVLINDRGNNVVSTVQAIIPVKSIDQCYENYEVDLNEKKKKNKIRYKKSRISYKCDSCDKLFPKFTQLLYHDQLIHKDLFINSVQCYYCSQNFIHKKRLRQHISVQHHLECKEQHRCNICHKLYNSKLSLRVHMIVHTGKNKCSECHKSFSSSTSLEEHTNRIHKRIKKYKCSYCEKPFYSNSEVKRHTRDVHLKLRRFKCDICLYETTSKQFLETHTILKHKSVKSYYMCDECGKYYNTPNQLDYHKKVNHGQFVDMFSCPKCEKIFLSQVGCLKHIKNKHTNSNENKLKLKFCSYCNSSFVSKTQLSKHIHELHMSSYEKRCIHCTVMYRTKHKCPLISNTIKFDYKSVIKMFPFLKQIKMNIETRMFDCNLCEKSYKTKYNVVRHVGQSHGQAMGVHTNKENSLMRELILGE